MAIATSRNVSRRLPNSITPWMPISGVVTSESAVHCGQVGQPSPDPVNRTAPPVATIRIWPTKVAIARARTRTSTVRGSTTDTLRDLSSADSAPNNGRIGTPEC